MKNSSTIKIWRAKVQKKWHSFHIPRITQWDLYFVSKTEAHKKCNISQQNTNAIAEFFMINNTIRQGWMNSKTNQLEKVHCKICLPLICELLRWDCISSSGEAGKRTCLWSRSFWNPDLAHRIKSACFPTGVFCKQLLIFLIAFVPSFYFPILGMVGNTTTNRNILTCTKIYSSQYT